MKPAKMRIYKLLSVSKIAQVLSKKSPLGAQQYKRNTLSHGESSTGETDIYQPLYTQTQKGWH